MTRDEAVQVLAALDGMQMTLGGLRYRVGDYQWSYEGRWLTLDIFVLPTGPGIAVMPASPNWNALKTALGLDPLTVQTFENRKISDTQYRLAATFTAA